MTYVDSRDRLDLSIPALLDAGQKHGVENLRIFGSLARRDTDGARDVDLLVDLKSNRTLLNLVAFRRKAEKVLAVPVDVATVDMLKERIRAKVLLEARPLPSSRKLHHDQTGM
ncbi:MAG TPA: nucleotidyltransferase domain-containing protein [Solirubrobacterales bacterium]